MALASKLAAIQGDLAALSGAITYRQLADQLKAAIAVAQANGLAVVAVTYPTHSVTYPSINVATLALQVFEEFAVAETGGVFKAKCRLT